MNINYSKAQAKRYESNRQQRFETWLKKAKLIHNDKFDYSLVQYKSAVDKVTIICRSHGAFEQRAGDHTNSGHGCPKCAHSFPYTHADFVEKSKTKYGDKFSVVSTFIGMKHPIELSCKFHGNFILNYAEVHFNNSGCCPSCYNESRLRWLTPSKISKAETAWLDSFDVPLRQHRLTIDSQTFIVDGFDPSTNTVYEYYGSYWHGNPEIYNASDLNQKTNKTFGELYESTMKREQLIKQYYHLVTKWA